MGLEVLDSTLDYSAKLLDTSSHVPQELRRLAT
jgi:hypothetical protein